MLYVAEFICIVLLCAIGFEAIWIEGGGGGGGILDMTFYLRHLCPAQLYPYDVIK